MNYDMVKKNNVKKNNMKRIKLNIKGMHCQSCETLIKDALEEIGIKRSEINSKTNQAEIEFDEKKISLDKIKKTIEKEGYEI